MLFFFVDLLQPQTLCWRGKKIGYGIIDAELLASVVITVAVRIARRAADTVACASSSCHCTLDRRRNLAGRHDNSCHWPHQRDWHRNGLGACWQVSTACARLSGYHTGRG